MHYRHSKLIDWLIEHGFTSAPTQYRLYGRRYWPQATVMKWFMRTNHWLNKDTSSKNINQLFTSAPGVVFLLELVISCLSPSCVTLSWHIFFYRCKRRSSDPSVDISGIEHSRHLAHYNNTLPVKFHISHDILNTRILTYALQDPGSNKKWVVS